MDRLSELSIFLAIVDAGSLVEAARGSRRSAVAVTRSLSALENRLGTRLIERTTRRLTLTESGKQFTGHARRLLADYDEAVRATGSGGPLKGLLRVTAPVVFGREHVMPMVIAFQNLFPDIRIEMICSDNNLDLIEQEIDLAVRIGPLADSSLVARRVGEVRRVMVASPGYLADRGKPRNLDDLAKKDLIFTALRPTAAEWRFSEKGKERILRLIPRLVVNQVEAALLAARQGHGIARALSYQVADDLESGRLVRILPGYEPSPLPIHLLVPSVRYLPARTRAFLDHAVTALKTFRRA